MNARRAWMRQVALALFVAALLMSRAWRLGEKVLHHDESLFGYYSHFLAGNGVYEYDPILHGPLLIELTATGFRLLGDNGFTLRLIPLMAGLALFALLLLLRPWLGRPGLTYALLLLLVSPNLCYYSRFLRNDVLFLMLTTVNLAAIVYTLRSNQTWPIVLWPVSLALLVSNKENVVFVMASQVGFALLWIALDGVRIARARPVREAERPTAAERATHVLKRINVSALVWLFVAWGYSLYLRRYIPLGGWGVPLWIAGVLATAALLELVLQALRDNPARIGLAFRLYERIYLDRYWWVTGLALAVATVYYTYSICLTWPQPLLGMLAQTVRYWWGEHASQRLGGPFHVYAGQIALYEAPAWGIVLAALERDWLAQPRRRALEVGLWAAVGLAVWVTSLIPVDGSDVADLSGLSDVAGAMAGLGRWTLYARLSESLRQQWGFLHIQSLGALFWAASVAYWGLLWSARSLWQERTARGWFIFWLFTSYLFYGYAGEKVPWLALHIVLPLWLLAAVLWNEWEALPVTRARRVVLTALVAMLLTWNAWQSLRLCFTHPTSPAELAVYNHTQPPTQAVAELILAGFARGDVTPERVVIQGEAAWPMTWYMRNLPGVRFVDEEYHPTPMDMILVADLEPALQSVVLRQEFEGKRFALRTAWMPPSVPFNEILCVRALWGEPEAGFFQPFAYRLKHSARILATLGRYVIRREPFDRLPAEPGTYEYWPVYSSLWQRARPAPEPLREPE